MNVETKNSSSPASPSPGSDKPSSAELNSLQHQYAFFRIEEGDSEQFLTQSNKKQMTKLLKMLQKKGLLVAESFMDYVIMKPFKGGQSCVYKLVEKKEHDAHLNPDGSYFGGKCLALKKMDIFLTNPLDIKPRELELMSEKFHKSAIQAEKVFFEYDHVNVRHTVNIVMPWYKHTLITWMLKKDDNQGYISEIKNNKRRFEEVRRILRSILKGISGLHADDKVHMDIKPENIFINEYYPEKSEEMDEKDKTHEYNQVLIQEAIIGDFGMSKDITNSSTNFGCTREYAAPEILAKDVTISSRADIFSFGMILYKIFITEVDGAADHLNSDPSHQINKENVKKRIEILFPNDKDTISDSMIEDIAKIIKISLEYNLESRPQASNLLLEHEFFKLSQKELPRIHDFEIENTFEYGLKLLEGKNGYPKDLKKARKIFKRLSLANNQAHWHAVYFYGLMASLGLGGEIKLDNGKGEMGLNPTAAKSYFESHSEDPLGFSDFAIGSMYFFGQGVSRDRSKALEFFQKSPHKRNSFSQWFIGGIHQSGLGVEKNTSLAFDFYKQSAQQGNCLAQHFLSTLYEKGENGVEQDYDEAFRWVKLSADQGFVVAQKHMNLLYEDGHGVSFGSAE